MKNYYLSYVKHHKLYFILGPIAVILAAVGEIILPRVTADILNIGAANGDIPYIIRKGILMAGLSIAMLVFGFAGAAFAVRASVHFGTDLRHDIFRRVQKYSFANLDDLTTGSLITRITNDVTQVEDFVQHLVRGTIRAPIMIIGAVIMSFSINTSLAWVFCIVIPALALATFLLVRASLPRYGEMQARLDNINTSIEENIGNEFVVKSFVREDYEEQKFADVNQKLYEKSIRALRLMIWLQPLSTIAINITTIAIVWVAGRQIMIGNMEVGSLIAFITYMNQILGSLTILSNILLRWSRASASSGRIREVFDEPLDLTDETAAFPEKIPTAGGIEMRDVSFRYFKKREQKVLDHISFTIRPGSTVGIVGSTGSGKSTLVSLIPRLYDADEGEVLVDGVNVRDYSFSHLRDSISVVLQKNLLFSGTITENLQWGKEDATDEELRKAVADAQAEEFIAAKPNGYDTEIGQGGSNLSGGQKQRLCIARALLRKPKILILDDSTSALDTATDAKFRAALDEYRETAKRGNPGGAGLTCIVIAQRITSVIDADQILVLDNGKLVGNGTHRELMQSCTVYREIYLTQKEDESHE